MERLPKMSPESVEDFEKKAIRVDDVLSIHLDGRRQTPTEPSAVVL
jgi:hypothetical protein